MAAFEVAQVVASGSAQELVCQTIALPAPVEEIKSVRKTVIVDNCKVLWDKIIVDGRLRKDILFKAAHAGFPIPGTPQGCAGVTSTITGTLGDIDVEIAFIALIPAPGAQPGDTCVILQAFVEGEKEEPAGILHTGAFTQLIDKSVVFLCAKAIRETNTTSLTGATGASGATGAAGTVIGGTVIGAGGTTGVATLAGGTSGGLCPPRPTTGFVAGNTGTVPPPTPGPLPGTWIGPTITFPGVLGPGAPSAIPPTGGVHSTQPAQVQIAPATSPPSQTGTGSTGGITLG